METNSTNSSAATGSRDVIHSYHDRFLRELQIILAHYFTVLDHQKELKQIILDDPEDRIAGYAYNLIPHELREIRERLGEQIVELARMGVKRIELKVDPEFVYESFRTPEPKVTHEVDDYLTALGELDV